jgi:hypothetical protein
MFGLGCSVFGARIEVRTPNAEHQTQDAEQVKQFREC